MREQQELSRRERQIMDILHARGEAVARAVQEAMADAPSYSAVRALLRILEEKGQVKHREEGKRYVYFPQASHEQASQGALRRVVSTFFAGSRRRAIAALLEQADTELSADELKRLQRIIKKAKEEGR